MSNPEWWPKFICLREVLVTSDNGEERWERRLAPSDETFDEFMALVTPFPLKASGGEP